MTTSIKLAFGATVIALIALIGLTTQPAQAWKTDQNGYAECTEEDRAIIRWSFTNTEPAGDHNAMDVVARDTTSGNKSPKVTVNPGETATGIIDPGMQKIEAGTVVFDLAWTDGRSGIDSRSVSYDATMCLNEDVCREGLVIWIAQGTRLETDGDVEDCEPKDVQVCRDDVVVTVSENEVVDTDGDVESCESDETEVCRDGEVITVNTDEVKDTDGKVADCDEDEEEKTPAVLPNTGPGAAIASIIGIGGLGTTVRSWLNSKKQLTNSLLK